MVTVADPNLAWKLNMATSTNLWWTIFGCIVVGIVAWVIWHTESKLEKDFEDNTYGV